MTYVEIEVPGRAQPGGSKRALPRGARPGARPVLVDANKNVGAWKDRVSIFARFAMGGRLPLDGPLQLELEVFLVRPKGHFGAKGLKPSAPARPAVKPDLTKYLRAIEDALTGIVWHDDAQVVSQRTRKLYGQSDLVLVKVSQVL